MSFGRRDENECFQYATLEDFTERWLPRQRSIDSTISACRWYNAMRILLELFMLDTIMPAFIKGLRHEATRCLDASARSLRLVRRSPPPDQAGRPRNQSSGLVQKTMAKAHFGFLPTEPSRHVNRACNSLPAVRNAFATQAPSAPKPVNSPLRMKRGDVGLYTIRT